MHLSRILSEVSRKYKPKYEYHFREIWKIKGSKMTYPKAYIPDEVKLSLGSTPEEMLSSTRYEKEMHQNTTINMVQQPGPKLDFESLLIDKDPIETVKRPEAFLFSQYNRFEFGTDQAAVLTKTNCFGPFLTDETTPVGDRSVLERFILKANWWITNEDKLPRRFNSRKLIYKHKPEYGILPKDSIRFLLKDFFEYCTFLNLFQDDRLLVKDHFLETFYHLNGSRINFSEFRDFVLTANKPLQPFEPNCDLWQYEITNNFAPIDPKIDLKRVRHYKEQSNDGWNNTVPYIYPQIITINLDLPNRHSDFLEPEARQITESQKISIGIMNCFAQCLAIARRLYGDDAVDNCRLKLPHPIAVQGICFDGVEFDFIYYQLNTTDFVDKTYSNMAWIDNGNKLFDKMIPTVAMLRSTKFENLNMKTFEKFFRFFSYGFSELKNK